MPVIALAASAAPAWAVAAITAAGRRTGGGLALPMATASRGDETGGGGMGWQDIGHMAGSSEESGRGGGVVCICFYLVHFHREFFPRAYPRIPFSRRLRSWGLVDQMDGMMLRIGKPACGVPTRGYLRMTSGGGRLFVCAFAARICCGKHVGRYCKSRYVSLQTSFPGHCLWDVQALNILREVFGIPAERLLPPPHFCWSIFGLQLG